MDKEIAEEAITKIIKLHLEVNLMVKKSIDYAIEIGNRLLIVKNDIEHGKFTKWIESNMPFSVRTGQNYIKLYNRKSEINEKGITDISTAYDLLTENRPKFTVVKFDDEDNDEDGKDDEDIEEKVIIPETKLKDVTPKQKDALDYEGTLRHLILDMDRAYNTLKIKRNSNTPLSLSYFIGNIKDMEEVLATWLPENLDTCGYCNGEGCEFCINGKSGMSKESEN